MTDVTDTAAIEAEFRDMCQRHDLTYEYSDDHRYWTRGRASEAAIRKFAEKLPPETAARIWNEVVDTKLLERARQQFYWR